MLYLKRISFVALVKPANKLKTPILRKSMMSTSKAFELLHMDLFGPTQYTSIVYFDYMFSIARLSLCSSISSYSARSKVQGVSGRHCVSVVLICCLPADPPYIPGHVVDRGCDTFIESIVVHSQNIGQVGSSYEEGYALFLIFLSNIPYV